MGHKRQRSPNNLPCLLTFLSFGYNAFKLILREGRFVEISLLHFTCKRSLRAVDRHLTVHGPKPQTQPPMFSFIDAEKPSGVVSSAGIRGLLPPPPKRSLNTILLLAWIPTARHVPAQYVPDLVEACAFLCQRQRFWKPLCDRSGVREGRLRGEETKRPH